MSFEVEQYRKTLTDKQKKKVEKMRPIRKKIKKRGYKRKDRIKKWCEHCLDWYLVVTRQKCDICSNQLVPYIGQDKEE